METIVAVMLLVGCDQSMMVCRQHTDPAPQYSSIEQCEDDMNLQIRLTQRHPVTIGKCVDAGVVTETQEVALDWQMDRVGQLTAEVRIRDTGALVASAF